MDLESNRFYDTLGFSVETEYIWLVHETDATKPAADKNNGPQNSLKLINFIIMKTIGVYQVQKSHKTS